MKTGVAHLPLHGGKAPRWLFEKMVELSGAILELMVIDKGPEEVLKYLSNPFWFQAFGCVLGFDWHSSGLTTTTCGAVKEALKKRGPSLGLFIAGGKGKTSLKVKQITSLLSDSEIAAFESEIIPHVDLPTVDD